MPIGPLPPMREPSAIEMQRFYDRQLRNKIDRRRAMIYRMMGAGLSPGDIAQRMQLMSFMGVEDMPPMSPLAYAQMTSPQAAPQLYATGLQYRLGREGLATRRYGDWIGARRDVDVAALQGRAATMGDLIRGETGFYQTRPGATPPASPYDAAAGAARYGYEYADAQRSAQEASGAFRSERALRDALISDLYKRYSDPNTPEDEKRTILATIAQMMGTPSR
ncbi:MAG TPA: hypothetical protein PL047_09675 [Methanothrix sp.]|nr:hypothetical protein [Methanothrix sp.]